jgi:hypothetical protein
MHNLASEAWNLYRDAQKLRYVVQPSVPILYFGDAEAYFRSKHRIITVGLNPSLIEFPADDPYTRFPDAKSLSNLIESFAFYDGYLQALNHYFAENPYRSWFATFEAMLEGLDCSYYSRRKNTALHTDLCSPLATNPTWSKLSKGARSDLEQGGIALWHSLVEHLRPHFILISVAKQHLPKIQFPALVDWRTVYTLPRENPYELRHCVVQLEESSANVVFGQAAQKPFGTVSSVDKSKMGRYLSNQEFK